MALTSLRVTEIFLSIQGEAGSVGYPTVFIRLTGCPLRCHYCDSEYAFYGGEKLRLDEIVSKVDAFKVLHVCVTGGEPLAQPYCHQLLSTLCDRGYFVSLETSGALSIADVDARVAIVMDLKTPASGEAAQNDYTNLKKLEQKDQIKFVICDKQDFDWAAFKVGEYELTGRTGSVFFSPAYEQLSATKLAEWILAAKLPVRLQIQLHKVLWGDKPGV